MAWVVRGLRSLRTKDEPFLAENSETGARRQKLETEVRGLRESLAAVETAQNGRRGKLEGLEARLTVLSEAQKQAGPRGGRPVGERRENELRQWRRRRPYPAARVEGVFVEPRQSRVARVPRG